MIGDQPPNGLGSPCFTCVLIEAMEFRPRIIVPKVGSKNSSFCWEDIFFLLNCWFFLLNNFRREFSCLIGKLIRLKISSPKIENHFNQKIETSTFLPWKKVVGLRFWMLDPPPLPSTKNPTCSPHEPICFPKTHSSHLKNDWKTILSFNFWLARFLVLSSFCGVYDYLTTVVGRNSA